MKKFLLFATAFCLAGIVSKAQTQKGYYLIGGDIASLNADLQKGGSSFGLGVSPKVAWFIKDNLAVGGQVNLNFQTAKGAGSTVGYSVGPLARYYFSKSEVGDFVKHTTFFAEANAGIGGKSVSKGGGSTNGLDVGVGPGLAFFVNQNIALELLAKYNLTAGFGSAPVSSGINLGLGFQIYLPGSKLKAIKNEVR